MHKDPLKMKSILCNRQPNMLTFALFLIQSLVPMTQIFNIFIKYLRTPSKNSHHYIYFSMFRNQNHSKNGVQKFKIQNQQQIILCDKKPSRNVNTYTVNILHGPRHWIKSALLKSPQCLTIKKPQAENLYI
jgi:hypothetical protein